MAWSDFPNAGPSVDLLRRSLERGRLGHAYLLTGEDIGLLERLARELTQTVNCQGEGPSLFGGSSLPPQAAPTEACGKCSSCRRIREGLHPDVHWLRAESKSRIIRADQIRSLINAVQLKPTEARFKVGILVDADRLHLSAANAFLKTLEEPPPSSLLLLLTTEPGRLLETILSRCLRLHFAGESATTSAGKEAMLPWLRSFAAVLEQPPKSLLARYRLLDDLLQQLGQLREAAETDAEARSPAQRFTEADASLRDQWEEEAKAAAEASYRQRRSQTLRLLQWWFRDIWLVALGQAADRLAFPELQVQTAAVARRLDPDRAQANLQLLEETQTLLHTNVQEALALEVALLRLQV